MVDNLCALLVQLMLETLHHMDQLLRGLTVSICSLSIFIL